MKRKVIFGLSIILLSNMILTSCDKTSSNQTSDITSSGLTYDSSWEPGGESLTDAVQPEVKNPSGEYSAPISKLRASQEKIGLPNKGQANILVVPIQFKGDDASVMASEIVYTSAELANLDIAYFGTSNEYPSVSEYYSLASNNQLKLSGVVSPLVELEYDYSYYLGLVGNGTTTPFELYVDILDYVYEYLFVTTETYYDQDFDSNDDGKVDGIVLAYDWPSFKSDTGYSMDDSSSQTIVEQFFNSETYFYHDIKEYEKDLKVNSFTFTSGKYISSGFVNGSSYTYSTQDSHEFIKQVGRMLGLEDYSDSVGKTIDSSSVTRAPLGSTDMMEVGVGELNPFSLSLLGYLTPQKLFASSVTSDVSVTLNSENDTLLLGLTDKGIFSEYLLIQYYDADSRINELDHTSPYYLGYSSISESGVRVYKVDARLVRGLDDYELYESEPDYDALGTDRKGEQRKYSYDFAFTNDYENHYSSYGISFEFPLIQLLKKDETNRHAVDSTFNYTSADLYKEGDSFGGETDTNFYRNFKFDGDGYTRDSLGLSFKVSSLNDDGAVLNIGRID